MNDDSQANNSAKNVKKTKPPKKNRGGVVIYEPQKSIRKINIFRDKLISFCLNLNLLFSFAIFLSVSLNAWMLIQPYQAPPFFVQYTSGLIAQVKLYSKENLPPPLPLDIAPLSPYARLDDAPVYIDSQGLQGSNSSAPVIPQDAGKPAQ